MFPIVKALDSINYSLSHPTNWEIASVIISGISLFATVFVIFYNRKSITMAQKSINQAVNLQLYEKRLELFNRLSAQNAFENAPLELKIVFSNQIYTLYNEISVLCRKRWEIVGEYVGFCLVYNSKFHQMPPIEPLYNLCDETISFVIGKMEQSIQRYKDNSVALEDLSSKKDVVEKLSEQIRKKLPALEKEMEQIIKNSIGIEE